MSRVYASFWMLTMIPARHRTFTPYTRLISGLFILDCPHFSGPVIRGNSRYETLICRKPGRFGPLKSWSRVSLEAIFPVLWVFSEVCCLPSHYPCSLASSYSGIRTSLMQIVQDGDPEETARMLNVYRYGRSQRRFGVSSLSTGHRLKRSGGAWSVGPATREFSEFLEEAHAMRVWLSGRPRVRFLVG